MDLDSVSVHKQAKNELGQYPAVLTEKAWSITHIYKFGYLGVKALKQSDIFSGFQLHESLAKLVTENLHVKRWLFKMDNEFDGRGTGWY